MEKKGMYEETFLVTGAMGCLGAWVVRNLVQAGKRTVAFDLSNDTNRLDLIMDVHEVAQVTFIHGDITDREAVVPAVADNNITHIIHLAALQVPFCKANPSVGAAVNVVGTVNVFEAAKAAGIKQLVYASSVAVYGRKEEYPDRLLRHNAPLHPHTHYGVFKQANEGTSRVYWQDDGIASIGLRPYILYGPGRDQGLTSAPTKAMLAAARGEAYHIPFGSYSGFQFNDDVAKIFLKAARKPFRGAEVFNLRGAVVHMQDIVSAIEEVEPAVQGRITFEDMALSFPEGQDDTELRHLLGDVPDTSLVEGVAQTVKHFKHAVEDGRLPKTSEQS